MPSLSFKAEFVPAVEHGLITIVRHDQTLQQRLWYFRDAHPNTIKYKRNTIRQIRSNPIKSGDTLQLYTGMRTKYCRKIGEVSCEACYAIEIQQTNPKGLAQVEIESIGFLTQTEIEGLAKMDGFRNWTEMFSFFSTNYPLPFKGVLITW